MRFYDPSRTTAVLGGPVAMLQCHVATPHRFRRFGWHDEARLTPRDDEHAPLSGTPSAARSSGLMYNVPSASLARILRILDWLHANEEMLGLRNGQHMAQPSAQLNVTTLAAGVPPATSLIPYEKFVLPLEPDGGAGASVTHQRLPAHGGQRS